MARKTNVQHDRETLEELIACYQEELRVLQDETCKHKKAVKTAHGDSGNYDRSDDRFWYEFKCPECGKFWTEPQANAKRR